MKNVKTEKVLCDGILDYVIEPTPEEFDKGYRFVKFEVIDITKDDEEFIQKLAIIRGDVYEVCKGIVDNCIVVFDWENNDIVGSAKSLEQYVKDENMEDVPIFFIFDNGLLNLSFEWDILLLMNGYLEANTLVQLENNKVLLKAKNEIYKSMLKTKYEVWKSFWQSTGIFLAEAKN